MQITGFVVRRPFGGGTKSERDAVIVDCGTDSYVLRRQGGNAFHDPDLDRLVGRRMRFEGTLVGYTFVFTSASPDDDA